MDAVGEAPVQRHGASLNWHFANSIHIGPAMIIAQAVLYG